MPRHGAGRSRGRFQPFGRFSALPLASAASLRLSSDSLPLPGLKGLDLLHARIDGRRHRCKDFVVVRCDWRGQSEKSVLATSAGPAHRTALACSLMATLKWNRAQLYQKTITLFTQRLAGAAALGADIPREAPPSSVGCGVILAGRSPALYIHSRRPRLILRSRRLKRLGTEGVRLSP